MTRREVVQEIGVFPEPVLGAPPRLSHINMTATQWYLAYYTPVASHKLAHVSFLG